MNILCLENNGLFKLDTINILCSNDINIYVLTREKSSSRLKGVKDYIVSDYFDIDKLLSDIIAYSTNNNVTFKYVFTFTEFLIEIAGMLNMFFGNDMYGYISAKIARNKFLTKHTLKNNSNLKKVIPFF